MKIVLIRSLNSATKKQKENARSLGLKNIGDCSDFDINNSSMYGRFNIVKHLVCVQGGES